MSYRTARWGRIAFLSAIVSALVPGIALAHPFLRRSFPAAADVLAVGPRELRLVFSEPIELRFTKVELAGPDGTFGVLKGLAIVPDSLGTVAVAVETVLAPGDYTVRWQAAGDDGHVVRGEFGFTVRGTRAGGEAAGGVVTPGAGPVHELHHPTASSVRTDFDASSPGFVALRWLMYVGLLGIIGAVVFQAFVLPAAARRGGDSNRLLAETVGPRAAAFGRWAAVVFLVSLPGRLGAQSYAMHGPSAWTEPSLLGGMLGHTVWGWSLLAQFGLGALALFGFHRAARGTPGLGLVGFAAVLLAFTPAFAGHAIAAERWIPAAVVADGIHVLGAAGWLGTLAVLVLVGLRGALRLPAADRGPIAANLVNAFSPVALVCAGATALTGVGSAVVHIGRIADLWEAPYGQVLLLKLGVLSVVAATGAYNWRTVRPAMGTEPAARRVARSATVELVVALVVLLVTAVLVALPTPLAARGS